MPRAVSLFAMHDQIPPRATGSVIDRIHRREEAVALDPNGTRPRNALIRDEDRHWPSMQYSAYVGWSHDREKLSNQERSVKRVSPTCPWALPVLQSSQ